MKQAWAAKIEAGGKRRPRMAIAVDQLELSVEANRTAHFIRSAIGHRSVDAGLELDFDWLFTQMLGLRLRRSEARKCVMSVSARIGKPLWIERSNRMLLTAFDRDGLNRYRNRLALDLAGVADRPLTPKALLSVLPISKQERLRWTKDGRLPQCGSVLIRQRHLISVPTYEVAMVEELIFNPGWIDEWRAADAESTP